jgi:hypothetical protein
MARKPTNASAAAHKSRESVSLLTSLRNDAAARLRLLLSAACLALLLAPGAWRVLSLPDSAIAQLCVLLTALALSALTVSGVLPRLKLSLALGLCVLLPVAALLLSWLRNDFRLEQLRYDLYGEMPLLIWLCYPLVFALVLLWGMRKETKTAITALALAGLLLIAAGVFQRLTGQWIAVFGSVAYAVPALIGLPPLLLWLAAVDKQRALVWRLAALAATAGILLMSYGFLSLLGLAALLLLLCLLCPQLLLPARLSKRWLRRLRLVAGVALALLVAALIFVLVPAFSGSIISRTRAQGLGDSFASRIEMAWGAQAMLAKRPLTGFGPAGYRFSALRFLDPAIFTLTGSIGTDPVAYSPPSPHCLIWELLTRRGVVGTLLCAAAAVLWCQELRRRLKADPPSVSTLRAAAAASSLAAGVTLMATPFHFASGFLPTLLAALAIAPIPPSQKSSVRSQTPRTLAVSLRALGTGAGLLSLAAVLLCCGTAGFLIAQQTAINKIDQPFSDPAAYALRMEALRATIGSHPLLERRILDARLLAAADADAAQTLMKEALAQTTPRSVRDFGPNLVQFAELGMHKLSGDSAADTTAAAALLVRAQQLMPVTPALTGERLHLALLQGNSAEIAAARKEFLPVRGLYALGEAYLEESESAIK